MESSFRRRAGCLALAGAFGVIVIATTLIVLPRVSSITLHRAPTPAETPTDAPTKFAIAIESPTPTPSRTPTITPRPTATSTSRPTRAKSPTISPRKMPIAPTTVAPSPIPTATPVDVGEKYGALSVYPSPSDHSDALVEVNLAARGFAPVRATLGLVDVDGPADAGAPQLFGLFGDTRTPAFSNVYQVNAWDWNCNCAGALLASPQVTLAGLAVTPGEIIHVPPSSYYLGSDYQALVLYADNDRITLNYTRAGNPLRGYTIYLEGVAVDSGLLALYQQTSAAARAELPALQAGQGIGRALTSEIKVAIRDAGAFMDPRSRKDWWRGR